jgi:hypothetical protein
MSRATISIAVSHGGVTVDALRTIIGHEVLAAAKPSIIDDGVPGGAITELVWSGGEWEPKRIAVPTTWGPLARQTKGARVTDDTRYKSKDKLM